MPVDVGKAEIPTIKTVGELFMIQPQLMKDCGVEIVHVDLVLHCHVPEFIGRAVSVSGFEASPSEPGRETFGIVVPPRAIPLGIGGATEFASEPHDRVLEQPPLLEIGEQSRDRLVDRERMVGVLRHIGMLVPCRIRRVVAVGDLDKTHPRLTEAPGKEAFATEVLCRRAVADAV